MMRKQPPQLTLLKMYIHGAILDEDKSNLNLSPSTTFGKDELTNNRQGNGRFFQKRVTPQLTSKVRRKRQELNRKNEREQRISNLSSKAKDRQPLTDLTDEFLINNNDDGKYNDNDDQISDESESKSILTMNQQQQIRNLVNNVINTFKKSWKDQRDLITELFNEKSSLLNDERNILIGGINNSLDKFKTMKKDYPSTSD